MTISLDKSSASIPDPLRTGFLPVLTGSMQQKFDQFAIEKFGLPSLLLMENAAHGAATVIEKSYGPLNDCQVVICCGTGNNGGDGIVVARALLNHGAQVHVVLPRPPTTPDAKRNLEFLTKLEQLVPSNLLQIITNSDGQLPHGDLYIDAIFGVGLNRPLEGNVLNYIISLNHLNAPVIALDLPSGLHADTGYPFDTAIHADMTITFSAYNPGLLLGEGPKYSGQIELVPIGLPVSGVLDEDALRVDWISTDAAVASILPKRGLQTHKYRAGMTLIIGGSTGFSGAPMLAALAAARAGSGYVACAVPEQIQTIVASSITDIPSIGLPQGPNGGIDDSSALEILQPWIDKADAIVIGPGLGKYPDSQQFVHSLLDQCPLPMVIDADALAVASELLSSNGHEKNWILTPHDGEFNQMTDETETPHQLESAIKWSSKWNCTLVQKGYPTIISDAMDGAVICGTGNTALATAGSGDVLAGLCGGFLAQGCSRFDAAICASHIGGLASDLYALQNHPNTMIASDMLEKIIQALTSIQNI
ncbi:MAG: NAD(P)H-hydrate dehydratase [Bacteroidetes bacterium]|nr:NAD(P)H-hydrate dehydratase [Bacteroidota bacterium]